jgi:phage tail sheath protein FI
VYIEDVAPSQAAVLRTGVPVFVGFVQERVQTRAQREDKDVKFFRLTSWEQFEQPVGQAALRFLGYAVRGFFENGGECCVVVPLEVRKDQRSLAALKEALGNIFTKDANGRRGLLEDIEDTDLVCVPDIMMEEIRESQETVFELQQQVLEYCKDMGDRFAILDAFPLGDSKDIERTIQHWRALRPTEGALYFPWIQDRTGAWLPPCGHVAGIYARTDAQMGVHKAPANAIVEGAMDLEVQLTDEAQSRLNEVGVNCLRSFPGRGIRVWGARTLSRQPNWRYVNVRRLFLTLVRWIEHNMHDLVFEPSGPPLWDRVRDRLGSYCSTLFQRGALKGLRPAEAFFVKCDAETNPLEVRAAGQLICDVGLAPIMPAEFVVVRITQSAAGTTVTLPTGT